MEDEGDLRWLAHHDLYIARDGIVPEIRRIPVSSMTRWVDRGLGQRTVASWSHRVV